MGQEKTQRENGREQRDGRQGRFGRRMGLGVILSGPVPAGHGGKESGPPATADLVDQSSLSLKFWGLTHSCLGLTV